MRTPSLGAFFSKTNLLRWMINLLLLPPAAASATAYAQGGWQLVSHSRVAHQDDDVAEKLKSSPSPSARPALLRATSFLLHHQAEDVAHAP
jgi:hypothetical protein